MKFLVICLFAVVSFDLVAAKPSERGCIYNLGTCSHECEEGTHSYTSACKPKMPEATCDVPEPVQEKGDLCDFSACYCDPPTVRDTVTNKCVTLDKCPKKE